MTDNKDPPKSHTVPLARAFPRPPTAQMPGTTSTQGLSTPRTSATNAGSCERIDAVTNPQIVCPNCKTQIPVTDALAEPLVADARRRFEQQLAAKEADFGRREARLREAQSELSKARETIDEQVAAKLKAERTSIAEAEARKARLALADEITARDQQLTDMQQLLATNTEKLAVAQKAHADVLRKERELDDAKRELDLTVEKRIQDGLAGVRDKARLEAEDALKARVAEKEAQIAGMQRQIEDLKRKAEQGSQQLQGETSELELEALLRANFPGDLIEPVLTGHNGGDLLHRVLGPGGQVCGTILWESKRTKNWSHDWLAKVRNDQRAAKAEISLIVSSALPKGLETFDVIDNVWVAAPRFSIPLATVLRQWLIDVAASRTAQEGQQTKMELVYAYLTGPRFRQRIDAIVERFTDMHQDLDRERKMMTRLWAKREEQLRGVLDSTAGLYGDLQGIAGRAMQEIESLDVLMIETKGEAAE